MQENGIEKRIRQAVWIGCVSFLLTVLALIAAAAGIDRGMIGIDKQKTVVLVCLFISCLSSQYLLSVQKGGGISSLVSSSVMVFLIVLLSAAMKDSVLNLSGMLPVFFIGFAGFSIGTILKRNKSTGYQKKGKKR